MRPLTEGALFAVFRTLLGVYLTLFFARLVPYGPELFSSHGMLPRAADNPTHGYFPNLLAVWDSPANVRLFLALLAILASVFALGVARRWVALPLWYGWVCLCHRNNLIHNPALPYVAWLLLACMLIPAGEGLLFPGTRQHARTQVAGWRCPRVLALGAWLILGLGYSLSGLDKLIHSPSWRNGDALALILECPLARSDPARLLLALPRPALTVATWLVLGIEIGFGPLALWRRTRPVIWTAMVLVQSGILLVLDFAELTSAMLLAHLFVLDPAWLLPRLGAAAKSAREAAAPRAVE
jgi:hypothetical protein